MHPLNRWWQARGNLVTLASLFLLIPLASRYLLGWGNLYGYLSDLAIGSLLILLLHKRHLLLALPVMVVWMLMYVGNAELVSAVGRMPDPSDLHFLADPTFVGNSTEGGGISHPWLAGILGGTIFLAALLWRRREQPLPRYAYALPVALLVAHFGMQFVIPADADVWKQYNLPHRLIAGVASQGQLAVEDWLAGDQTATPPDVSGLNQQDLSGTPLLAGPGAAKNVLIITMEGIPGAYVETNRAALSSSYDESMMPKLSTWATRAMDTPDYVTHSHQTIRGLYAMLCGDFSELNNGTPKAVELLSNPRRASECLPSQLHKHGFTTHFLQGAGLRFMAKDKVMPAMGFDTTLGRDWFKKPPYLEFAWGMDDKAFFEGALDYIGELRKDKKPWMLTLLTVGTHQPYSATPEYLAKYPTARKAAVAYLDDAVDAFLAGLEKQGVLKDTLVIVTSDESHGIDNVRLASSWGMNLVLAPEQAALPPVKDGVYGHVDLATSILDYFGFAPPKDMAGRSLFREYDKGREMVSFTNGMLRFHDGKHTFTECDFQQVCRRYESDGFIADSARFIGRFSGREARMLAARADILDHSVSGSNGALGQELQFATREHIQLKPKVTNEYTDNLIGAQYLEFPADSRTTVTMKIRALQMDDKGARVQLHTREFEKLVPVPIPEFPLLTRDKPLEMTFSFDNERARKAFSFHLIAEGQGTIEITDFHVQTQPRKSTIDARQVAPTRVAGSNALPGPRIGGRPALMAGQLDELDQESSDGQSSDTDATLTQ
ncbi:LTA synthase family protein [Pseudomonas knackmussii]|uniref:LTA synthase family protein n=1 Tax=Pseudomonas knackmussii TaxID=65741 RepID=UPI003BE0818C